MKRTKLLGLALVATMASFTACTNDAEEVLAQEREIRLTSEITPSRVADPELQSTHIVSGRQVGVTITGATTDHNNVAWSVGNNGALTNTGDAVYYGNGTATITAYHPFNDDWDESTTYAFSVSKDQTDNTNYLNSDLLWTKATSSKTETAIPLTFSHKLAKINVTLVPEKSGDDLNGATISIYNTKISTTFNPTTGVISAATGEPQEIIAGVTADDVYTASAIVIPQEVSGKFIKITHENKTYYYTLASAKELVSGHSYSYTLTVKGKQLINTGSSIDEWDDTEDEGDAEEEVFKMPAVDLGLSVKWASYNLGSRTSLDCGDRYAWGEISSKTTFNEENYAYYNAGDYYDDLGDDISGTEYDAATAILGEGWRMPTKAEWEELLNNCTKICHDGSSSFYYIFESKINGNHIYIPKIYGSHGYWTSNVYNEYGYKAYYLNLTQDYFQIEDGDRWYTHWIRPVYDEGE